MPVQSCLAVQGLGVGWRPKVSQLQGPGAIRLCSYKERKYSQGCAHEEERPGKGP